MQIAATLFISSTLVLASACSEDTPTDASATATTTAAQTTPKPTTATTASATAAAPRADCPKGSSGAGTIEQPCAGKGTDRMMEVKWNNKIDDKGPFFNVKNISPAVILFGKIAVFYYDKAGKQLQVKVEGKDMPYKTCSGNIFQGIMKVDEKALIQFSCVGKDSIPTGTAFIEGEMITVGFADSTEKKSDFFWSNKDLAPDVRAKSAK